MRNREQQLVVPYMGDDGGPAEFAKYRFNWNSPLVPSPHDKNTVYLGGSVIFKSTDFGKTWAAISPDLTTNDKAKQKSAGGPVALREHGRRVPHDRHQHQLSRPCAPGSSGPAPTTGTYR